MGSEFLFEHAYCDWFYLKQIKINNLYCRGVVNGSQSNKLKFIFFQKKIFYKFIDPIVCDSN